MRWHLEAGEGRMSHLGSYMSGDMLADRGVGRDWVLRAPKVDELVVWKRRNSPAGNEKMGAILWMTGTRGFLALSRSWQKWGY